MEGTSAPTAIRSGIDERHSGNGGLRVGPAGSGPTLDPCPGPVAVHTCAPRLLLPAILLSTSGALGAQERAVNGWLDWRGPLQTGCSLETDLPERVEPGGESELWTYPLRGRGTPVVADGRVYFTGYSGEGADLQEHIVCVDEETGGLLWEHRFNDFLSDVIYDRYAISSPTIDPRTGNLFFLTTGGLLVSATPEGRLRWQVSLAEDFGRFTYPNGRTGAPVVDGDLCIVSCVTGSWGPFGPARSRLYAFHVDTGEHVWGATPGGPPKDAPYSHPVVEWRGGRRALYAGLGDGYVVAMDARTGDPLWRVQLATGGINASPVIHGDKLVVVHGRENLDSSVIGRLVALRLGAAPEPGGPVVELGPDDELWRNDALASFTSSPVLQGDRVYITVQTGELHACDATTGETIWRLRLAPDQIHASPAWGDGKLYVPMNNGSFHIVRPGAEGGEVLNSVQLEGNCLGAPAIWNGRVYVHTTEKLYCFGDPARAPRELPEPPLFPAPALGEASRLQVLPADLSVRVGESFTLRARSLDGHGQVVFERQPIDAVGECALATFELEEGIVQAVATRPGTTVVEVDSEVGKARVRLRVTPAIPFTEDFDSQPIGSGPPAWWLAAGPRFEVVELDGERVLAHKLDNPLFQRALCFAGSPEESGYTSTIDIRSEGNRRLMSNAGVVHQRYLIQLVGNSRILEISSNEERIKVSTPFRMKPDTWYTLRTTVDVAPDGSGVVRAKAWERDQPEPEEWTLEVPHARAHTEGAPGIFSFTPQSRMGIFFDNWTVTPHE